MFACGQVSTGEVADGWNESAAGYVVRWDAAKLISQMNRLNLRIIQYNKGPNNLDKYARQQNRRSQVRMES